MASDRFTSVALMHIHKDMPVDIPKIIEEFAIKQTRRIKLNNILADD